MGLLDLAEHFVALNRQIEKKQASLRGRTLINLFFEVSTRTQASFELAGKRLGADVMNMSVGTSSMRKGETLIDTAVTLNAMHPDLIVVRHHASGAVELLARKVDCSVINAGDGAHEHPTQGLIDLLTLADAWQGAFEGRRLAIVGDIAHSRVARSVTFGLTRLGGRVTVAGPATLLPRDVACLGCEVAPSVDEALRGADAVIALRLQLERMEQGLLPSGAEYARVWGLDAARVRLMQPHAVVLHPGPINREVEIASDVADGARSVILRQVENGVAVRAAVLEWCAARSAA